MEREHTLLPYKISKGRTLLHIVSDISGRPVTAISISPPRIPEKDLRDGIVAEAQANAEFIVRACNNFYNMLEVLKGVLNSDMAMREEDEGQNSNTLEWVRAVIAKAEGK